MTVIRRRSVLAGTAAAFLIAPGLAGAEGEWPKGPLKIIVPFPPGGSADPVARILQAKLIELTGWNIVVENKPGGTGVVGAAVVAKSPPDGQTWMLTFDSHILNPAFAPNIPYKDSELSNVMEVGRTPQVVVAHPDRPYKTMAEVVADARKRPGKISIGVLGTSQALVLMTLLKKDNDVDLNLIPYKGGGPLNQDILGGVTDAAIGSLTSLSPHIRSGKVRAIGVTSEKRTPALPDTPTLLEQGLKTYPSYSWWGIYVPAGTPRPIIDRMHAELTKAAHAPDVTQKFVDQFNMEILTTSPEDFAAYQKAEQERWFKVIAENNIKGD